MSNKQQEQPLGKSPYQIFMEANGSLIACYERVQAAQGSNPKPDPALLNQCNSHKEVIKGILQRNELTMTKMIEERIKILRVLQKTQTWSPPYKPDLD